MITTKIKVADLSSVGIRNLAARMGVEEVRYFGHCYHPDKLGNRDWAVGLYQVGDVVAIETNGDPVTDAQMVELLMKDYGIWHQDFFSPLREKIAESS